MLRTVGRLPLSPSAARPCLILRHPSRCGPVFLLHTTASLRQDEAPSARHNHYQTLGLAYNATVADVKKQFYALSKNHHPDLNPHDPNAAARFVKISEAYAVLGSVPMRERYDRDLNRALAAAGPSPAAPSAWASARRGSYSSTSSSRYAASTTTAGPAGGRPASGLSRRRTQFKGPPPSFYRAGAWGAQAAKRRQAQADATAAAAFASGATSSGRYDWSNVMDDDDSNNDDVPHFDRASHLRTQESHERRWRLRHAEHRSARSAMHDWADHSSSTSTSSTTTGILANFVFVSSVLALAVALPSVMLAVVGLPLNGREREPTGRRAAGGGGGDGDGDGGGGGGGGGGNGDG
ncbi:MAG: hypothetical protein M1826_002379 [Phylliscum demangeonii]|nr:MAG: hypothetical protein M1826_002379 [Phylliscum demangeonii]